MAWEEVWHPWTLAGDVDMSWAAMADVHAYLGLLLEKQNEGLLEKSSALFLQESLVGMTSANAILSALAPQGVRQSSQSPAGQHHTSSCIV